MKRLLVGIGLALALLLPLGTRADTVVCTATPQSPGTACSATSDSTTSQLQCACVGGTQSTLLTGIAHYWTMEEASGSRADSVGSMAFTPLATAVPNGAGVAGNAAILTKESDHALATPAGSVDPTTMTAFTVAGWFKTSSVDSPAGLVFGNNLGFFLSRPTAGQWQFSVYDGSVYSTTATTGVLSFDSSYHFVVAWFDRGVDGAAHIQVDGGTVFDGGATASYPTFTFRHFIGNRAALDLGFTGGADEIGSWSRALTSTERACLYNGGAGNFYPFTGVCTP